MERSLVQLVRYRENKVLPPGYVSTADSGNLAACLIVAIEALKELPQRKWDQKDILDAVHDKKIG